MHVIALAILAATTRPAFPGAEGFGALAQGGRGGRACLVTSLASTGPGSLQSCLDERRPRVIVFRVSGEIRGPLEVKYGRFTMAGQTSPRGIVIVGGLICDNVYDRNDCNDIVVQHMRFRAGAPDSVRLGGVHDAIFDHCSFETAEDENLEVTRSRNITIQNSIIAEPRGDHAQWGGVLINYSKDVLPLDGISLIHNVWNSVPGRLPEVSCEENDDGPGRSNCAGHTTRVQLVENVMFDVHDPIWFNRCTGTNEGNECELSDKNFSVQAAIEANVLIRRTSADPDLPLLEPAWFSKGNTVLVRANVQQRGDESLQVPEKEASLPEFPPVGRVGVGVLRAQLARTAGALPHDPSDQRLSMALTRSVDERLEQLVAAEADESAAPQPEVDADADGLPDAWERAHQLNPRLPRDATKVRVDGCLPAETALEYWANTLAAAASEASLKH